jgi:hypothetical protein
MYSQKRRIVALCGFLLATVLACLPFQRQAQSQVPGGSGQLGGVAPPIPSLTIKEAIPSSKYWPVEKHYAAVITGKAAIPPAVATSGTVTSPALGSAPAPAPSPVPVPVPTPAPVPVTFSWNWTFAVQHAAVPGEWRTPAEHSYSLKPTVVTSADTTTSVLTLDAVFHEPGDWQITGIQAIVIAQAGGAACTAMGSADTIILTVVRVSISPKVIAVMVDDLASPKVKVEPSHAAKSVRFTTKNDEIADVVGDAANLTVIGMGNGKTHLEAFLRETKDQLAITTVLAKAFTAEETGEPESPWFERVQKNEEDNFKPLKPTEATKALLESPIPGVTKGELFALTLHAANEAAYVLFKEFGIETEIRPLVGLTLFEARAQGVQIEIVKDVFNDACFSNSPKESKGKGLYFLTPVNVVNETNYPKIRDYPKDGSFRHYCIAGIQGKTVTINKALKFEEVGGSVYVRPAKKGGTYAITEFDYWRVCGDKFFETDRVIIYTRNLMLYGKEEADSRIRPDERSGLTEPGRFFGIALGSYLCIKNPEAKFPEFLNEEERVKKLKEFLQEYTELGLVALVPFPKEMKLQNEKDIENARAKLAPELKAAQAHMKDGKFDQLTFAFVFTGAGLTSLASDAAGTVTWFPLSTAAATTATEFPVVAVQAELLATVRVAPAPGPAPVVSPVFPGMGLMFAQFSLALTIQNLQLRMQGG